jgi:hypothetical protein
MSDVIILSSAESINSMSPHMENSKQLRDNLGYDLCLQDEKAITEMLGLGSYKSIIFTYGTGREYTRTSVTGINKMVERTGVKPKLFYLKNEYNIGENHVLWALCRDEDYTYEMITNNMFEAESRCKKYHTDWHIVNINNIVSHNLYLAWENQEPASTLFPAKNNYGLKEFSRLMYYGTFRKERRDYFKYWLDDTFFVSSSKKNWPKFKSVTEANLFPPMKDHMELLKFKYTLYMEDMVSTKYFTHLANRFYEALDYDIIMFFDAICKTSIEKDAYPIDDMFLVNDLEELHAKVAWCEESQENFMSLLAWQRKHKPQVVIEKKKTLQEIREIVEW